MTLYEFRELGELDRADALFDHGVFLTDIINTHYKLLLYQIESFYVEVWYDIKKSKIVKYRSFSNTDQLAPYLNQINLQGLG